MLQSIEDALSANNNLFSAIASICAIAGAIIAVVTIVFVRPIRVLVLHFLGRVAGRTHLGSREQSSEVDAIADNTTWSAKQTELLQRHHGELFVITRSSPFAHDADTYQNRLMELIEKIRKGDIRNVQYIISVEHLVNLYRYGKWTRKRLVSRLKSLHRYLDLHSSDMMDPNIVQVCDADFYFTYGIQIYASDNDSKSFLIFYIEHENGEYGASFVVKKHKPLIEHQKQYFKNWFNKLSGNLIDEARENIQPPYLEGVPYTRNELMRIGLCRRIERRLKALED